MTGSTSSLEPEQFAFELYGLMLSFHQYHRFLRDPLALERTRRTFDRLVASARTRSR